MLINKVFFFFCKQIIASQGAICQVQVVDGVLKKGDNIQSCYTQKSYEIKDVAYLSPEEIPVPTL